MKATLVLLPLLGTTYMLFFVSPGEDDLSQIVFIYFNSFLQSFQVGRAGSGDCAPLIPQSGDCALTETVTRDRCTRGSRAGTHSVTRTPDPGVGVPAPKWVWATLAGTQPCSEDSWQPVTQNGPQHTCTVSGGAQPALSLWGPGSECPPPPPTSCPYADPPGRAAPRRPLTGASFLCRASSCLSSTAS